MSGSINESTNQWINEWIVTRLISFDKVTGEWRSDVHYTTLPPSRIVWTWTWTWTWSSSSLAVQAHVHVHVAAIMKIMEYHMATISVRLCLVFVSVSVSFIPTSFEICNLFYRFIYDDFSLLISHCFGWLWPKCHTTQTARRIKCAL